MNTDEWIDRAEPIFDAYRRELDPVKIIGPRVAAIAHERCIGRGGHQHGIADFNGLEQALLSQYEALQQDGGSLYHAAACLAHAVVGERPFCDGNARSALLLSMTLLRDNGATIGLDPTDGADMMRAIERGEITATDTANWMYSGMADQPAVSAAP